MVEKRLCKTWTTPDNLESVVSRSLTLLMKTTPATGWVRADTVPDEGATKEIVRLSRRVKELEALLEKAASQAPEGSENLAQGDELYEIFYTDRYGFNKKNVAASVEISWNDLFALIAPLMINGASEMDLSKAIGDEIRRRGNLDSVFGFVPTQQCLGQIIVHFRSLGLIVESLIYWKLTPAGDSLMTRLLA